MPSIKAKTVPITVKNPLTPQAHDPKADERRIARRSPRGKGMPSTNPSGATSNNEITIRQKMPNPNATWKTTGVITATTGTKIIAPTRTRLSVPGSSGDAQTRSCRRNYFSARGGSNHSRSFPRRIGVWHLLADCDFVVARGSARIRAGHALPSRAAPGNAAFVGFGIMGLGCQWILHRDRHRFGFDAGHDDRIQDGLAAGFRLLRWWSSGPGVAFTRSA